MKFTAVGDAIIQRRIQKGFAGFSELAPFIGKGDARFFNLETTLSRDGECCASQFSGGTYLRADPEVLSDLIKFGFNMTSFNNNHALDFSYAGLGKTYEQIEKSGLVHAGVGFDLARASAPRYLETSSGRVALISVNTSFEPSMMAGNGNKHFKGRAGVNGLRIKERLTVNRAEFNAIRDIAKRLGINTERDIDRAEGYLAPLSPDCAELGELVFHLSEKTQRELRLDERDICRVEGAIYEAKFFSDYVLLSVHSHEIDGEDKESAPKFLSEFAHRVIDAGADAVVGHGPHLLRPIEIYNDKPIFYSLGDFILQLYSVESAPADFFERYELSPDSPVRDLLEKRSQIFSVGLMEDRKMMESIIPYWKTINNKLTELTLMPIELTREGNKSEIGLPRKAKSYEMIERLLEISKPYGIKMTIENDGTVKCKW